MTYTAQAIVFPEVDKVELRKVTLPKPGEWDVVVEVEDSAISLGTERWSLIGKRPAGDVTFPCIPGYLSIGRVIGGGESAMKRFALGDRLNFLAAKMPEGYGGNWMCGHLNPAIVEVDPSKLGLFSGMPYVEKVPEGLAGEEASLAGLAAVACRGIDMANIQPDQKVVVVGQGMIGHAAAQICRLRGAKVLTADTMPSRVELSRQLAADLAIDSSKEDLTKYVADFTEGEGADVVIDTSGSMIMLQREVELLRLYGKLVLQGWYPQPNQLDLHRVQLKFATLVCPCGHSGDAVSRCMNWMQRGLLNLKPLITHRFKPEQAVEAYDLVVNRPQETMGIVFDWRKSS